MCWANVNLEKKRKEEPTEFKNMRSLGMSRRPWVLKVLHCFAFLINSAHWNLISDEFYILLSQQWWIEPTKKHVLSILTGFCVCLLLFLLLRDLSLYPPHPGLNPGEFTSELCTSLCRMLFVDFSGKNSVLVLFCTPSLLPSLPLSVNRVHALIIS